MRRGPDNRNRNIAAGPDYTERLGRGSAGDMTRLSHWLRGLTPIMCWVTVVIFPYSAGEECLPSRRQTCPSGPNSASEGDRRHDLKYNYCSQQDRTEQQPYVALLRTLFRTHFGRLSHHALTLPAWDGLES